MKWLIKLFINHKRLKIVPVETVFEWSFERSYGKNKPKGAPILIRFLQ